MVIFQFDRLCLILNLYNYQYFILDFHSTEPLIFVINAILTNYGRVTTDCIESYSFSETNGRIGLLIVVTLLSCPINGVSTVVSSLVRLMYGCGGGT